MNDGSPHELAAAYALDALDGDELRAYETHLAGCSYCARRYRFEETLRTFVRQVCSESMPPELKAKLKALRTPL